MNAKIFYALCLILGNSACTSRHEATAVNTISPTYQSDLEFLQQHTKPIVLTSADARAQVVIVPAYQGRVMTSAFNATQGPSLGWINRELIASGILQEHLNAYGGEDRFWLGPEGGQFSIFFKPGTNFTLAHWFTPAPIDSEPFELIEASRERARLRKQMHLENYSGTRFDLEVNREVRLLNNTELAEALQVTLDDELAAVAFQSENKITNTGANAWQKETGLLSIWILGMFPPSAVTTVVVPLRTDESAPIVNDDYFGKVPTERLVVKEGVAYFSGDGQFRSKIGIGPAHARSILGSYDASQRILTLVQYHLPEGARDYVNSMWEMQAEPFAGDVVNSYNDGPATPGAKPFGPFYELETSSPAAALTPGASLSHWQRTIHLQGAEEKLDAIARATLGVGVAEITRALAQAK